MSLTAISENLYYFSRFIKKRLIILYYIVIPIFIIFHCINGYLKYETFLDTFYYILNISFFWCVVVSPLVFQIAYKTNFHKFYLDKAFFIDQTIIITDIGISHIFGQTQIFVEWKQIFQVIESESHYFIYYLTNDKKERLITLPKRVLDPRLPIKHALQKNVQLYITTNAQGKTNKRKFLNKLRIIILIIYVILFFYNLDNKNSLEQSDLISDTLDEFLKEYFDDEPEKIPNPDIKKSNEIDFNLVSDSVQNLLKAYPDQLSSFHSLPEKYQQKLVVPDLNDVPFNI
jgi:hypothetical protein